MKCLPWCFYPDNIMYIPGVPWHLSHCGPTDYKFDTLAKLLGLTLRVDGLVSKTGQFK